MDFATFDPHEWDDLPADWMYSDSETDAEEDHDDMDDEGFRELTQHMQLLKKVPKKNHFSVNLFNNTSDCTRLRDH